MFVQRWSIVSLIGLLAWISPVSGDEPVDPALRYGDEATSASVAMAVSSAVSRGATAATGDTGVPASCPDGFISDDSFAEGA